MNNYLKIIFKKPLSPSVVEILKNSDWSIAAWSNDIDFSENNSTPYLSREEKLNILSEWKLQHKEIKKVEEQIILLFGFDDESPLLDTLWHTFDSYTVVLGKLFDVDSELLYWYWLENDMGEKKLKLGDHVISSLDNLLELIEAGVNKNGLE